MQKERKFDVAVLGATGAVGETMISILEERGFPVGKLYALASENSEGSTILFKKKNILVENVENFDFSKVQIALFSAGASVAKQYAPKAVSCGAVVIDNSSAYRLEEGVPLVVPEVNASALSFYTNQNIIANPNCAVIQMVVAIKPIYDAVGIERLNVVTYQSVSGTGKAAITELAEQTANLLSGIPPVLEVYPKQIAFNVFPHCDTFQDNGYTTEEMKIILETQKILEDATLKVNPTAVRVPVFYGHSEAIHLETRQKITAERVRDLLYRSPGIMVVDNPAENEYPTPITEASGTDAVYVGRIREDISHPSGINLWVVADNVRKGAALNAVQIAEILINEYL